MRILWIQPCDANCSKVGKRTYVDAFPYRCTTCNSVLFSLCWFSRWCCSSASPTCFIFLPCSSVISISTSSFTGSKDAWLQKFLYFVRDTQHVYMQRCGYRDLLMDMLATVLTVHKRLYKL
ncbi:uncharacterized protein LOC110651959 [Hevea brasiliensis]|uniref:uncharacterized protein LOC110651959 n=1 Tax=Hevea brasiliensis TaxID=3981 RepID=UPI002600CC5C|nr:uncharacterized protein LOC110651959 [Hevea brasiliensis]